MIHTKKESTLILCVKFERICVEIVVILGILKEKKRVFDGFFCTFCFGKIIKMIEFEKGKA